MKSLVTTIILFFLLLVLISNQCSGEIGLGVAPSELTVTNALKGGEFEKPITIFNLGDETARFALNATGYLKDWVRFHEIDNETSINTILVAGGGSKKIIVKFIVPDDIANGIYNCTIFVEGIPEDITVINGATTTMIVKIPVEAMIEVTGTQILTGEVKSIATMDVEVNYPLRIKVDFQNTGNVIAKPTITINITKNGSPISNFEYSQTEIKPNSKETISIEWNTTGNEVGDYVANISVSLGGENLANKDLSFNILTEGTLTRQGELDEIFFIGEPLINRYLKILSVFKNTGEVDSNAQFKGEVYINGDFVDVIESDELTVPPMDQGTLTSYVSIENPGDYIIEGYVIFNGKKTETKATSFVVPTVQSEIRSSFDTGMLPFFIIIALFTIVFGVFILKKPRKEIEKRKNANIKEKQNKTSKENISQNKEDILADIKKHLSISTGYSSTDKK